MLNTQTSAVIERDKQGVLRVKVELRVTPDFASEAAQLLKVGWLTFEKNAFYLRADQILEGQVVPVVKEIDK